MRYLLILLLILCCLSLSANAADIVRYVDTGSDAGGDGTTPATSSGDNSHAYQSLNQWEAAENTNLDTANNTHTVHCNRTNSGGTDTTAVLINGWTTSPTDFITIIADDFPVDGIYDGTKYVLDNSTGNALEIREDYVRLVNLQILVTQVGGLSRFGVVWNLVGTSDLRVDSCIIKGVCSGSGFAYALWANDSQATINCYNTVIYGFVSGADADFKGIVCSNASAFNIYNCTIAGNYIGIESILGTVNCVNNAVFNNTDDFLVTGGTMNIDYCASDDGDGTNAQDFTAEATDWDKVFTDYLNADFTLKDYTTTPCAVGKGTDNPGSGLYSDDIIGTSRTSTWDIGAFEFEAAELPTGGQVIIIQMSMIPLFLIFTLVCFIRGKEIGK